MKEYKVGVWSIIKNVVIWVFFMVLVFCIVGLFLDDLVMLIGITAAISLSYVYLVMFGSRIYIRVDGNDFYIKKGKKEYTYKLDEVSIRAKTTNNGEADLYIRSQDDEKHFDCSLLGDTKFYELLEELGVVGEKQEVIKLDVKKK